MVQINAYVDDVVIISRNPKDLEKALQEIHNTAQEIGLIIKKENKIYETKKTHNQCKQIAIGGYAFERVTSFPY
jgi:hypothetical protein